MRFIFNERKAAQAAAHLLRRAGGKLEYIALIKLMYLADRRALLGHGLTITGDRMVSMPYGPVLSNVLNDINLGRRPFNMRVGGDDWYQYVSEPDGYVVSAVPGHEETDELSRYELRILDEVFEEFGAIDRWELVKLTHKLPEWHDPEGSSTPIHPEDILRHEGKSDDEIEEIGAAVDEDWFLSRLLQDAS